MTQNVFRKPNGFRIKDVSLFQSTLSRDAQAYIALRLETLKLGGDNAVGVDSLLRLEEQLDNVFAQQLKDALAADDKIATADVPDDAVATADPTAADATASPTCLCSNCTAGCPCQNTSGACCCGADNSCTTCR